MAGKRTLILDGERGELVKASLRVVKNVDALKSHSDAERRRRERINAHLATLRGLVQSNEKMDKAALLAQVITEIKQLKRTAKQATSGLHIPMDSDEVQVEKIEKNAEKGFFFMRASLCCDYRPELLSNIKQAIKDLPLELLKCEISTLGGRIKSVFWFSATEEGNCEVILCRVRSALSDIVDKIAASAELAQDLFFPQKKRRVSC